MTDLDDPFRLVGHTLKERYQVRRCVARGGFGVVYFAVDLTLCRDVAIKVLALPHGLDDAARGFLVTRFLDEARKTAEMRIPSVVQIFDFDVSAMPSGEKAPWMVLEWFDAPSLDAWLTARLDEPLTPRAALDLLRPVIEALAYAHQRGVVHRDVKPSNIVLVSNARPDQSSPGAVPLPSAKLLDFGLAKQMRREAELRGRGDRTSTPFLSFSWSYAAPEQPRGEPTGPATDVHALGLILTRLLTGRAPYGTNRAEIEPRVFAEQRPTPARFSVDVGPWEAVLARAVALRSADRHADARELLRALEGSVVEATKHAHGQATLLDRLLLWVSRWARPAALAFGGLALLAVPIFVASRLRGAPVGPRDVADAQAPDAPGIDVPREVDRSPAPIAAPPIDSGTTRDVPPVDSGSDRPIQPTVEVGWATRCERTGREIDDLLRRSSCAVAQERYRPLSARCQERIASRFNSHCPVPRPLPE